MLHNHFILFIINDFFFLRFYFQKRYLNLLYILLRDFTRFCSCLRAHYYYIRTQLLIITQINYFAYNYYILVNNIRKIYFIFQFIY